MSQLKSQIKPFDISKWEVKKAWEEVYQAAGESAQHAVEAWIKTGEVKAGKKAKVDVARRLGLAARCVPTARALHHYEFSRNPRKMYLLERNRLVLVATLWSARALVLLAPLFLALEVALFLLATAQGWRREKVEGWRWVLGHGGHLWRRRRLLAAERRVPQREWLGVLTPELAPHVVGSAVAARAVNVVVGAYWRLVRPLL